MSLIRPEQYVCLTIGLRSDYHWFLLTSRCDL
jgi:hypothetical protein